MLTHQPQLNKIGKPMKYQILDDYNNQINCQHGTLNIIFALDQKK